MKHSKRKLVREYCTIAPKDYAISNTHQPLSHSILKDYPLCGNEIKPSGLRTPLFLKAFLFIAMFLVVPSIAEAIYYNSSGNLGDWAFGATACTYDINNIMNCPASSTALLVNKTINLSTNTNSWCLEFYGMTMTSGNTVPNWLVHNKNLSTTPDATSYVFTRGKVGAGQDLYARDRLTNDIGIQTDFTSDENIKHGIRVCFLQNVSINITVDGVYVGNQPLTNVDNGTHLGLTHEASSNTSFEGVAIYNGTENTIVVPPDTTLPIINGSLNKSITTIYFGDVINATFNWTDETEGSYGNITWNLSTGKTFTNFSGLSETSGQISNATRISCYGGCVVNVTGYITDSSGNVKQNSTVFTVSDNILPLANVSLNNTSPKINEVINISVNATDETGLSFCQFINNQTGSKVFINTSISGTSDRCFQAFTVSVGRGNAINFSVVVNDTSNNKKTNSTQLTILNSNTNASHITNTSGLNYNTNITFNWTAGNDPDLDAVYHLVYWSEDGNNFYLYSNTTLTNSSSNATVDGTYIFMVNATDYFGSIQAGIVWNFTLDTNTPVLTYNLSNNFFTNRNQTLKITMEDANPFNITSRFYSAGTINEKSNQTPYGRFINITLSLNVTEDGNYTIEINGSDKHTAKSFPALETSYVNGTLSFISTNNPNKKLDLEFAYKVGTGDIQKITSNLITTYNIQKLITNEVDRISFGLEADTPPTGQNIKFGFRFLDTQNTKLIAQNENTLFHLYGRYWLDFKTYIVNVATGQKTLLQEKYLNQNGYHVVYYDITFADYGLSVGNRFRIITESIGGLNFVDETRTIVYDFTAPTFVDATNRSAADNSSNILTNTDVNISIFGLDDLYLDRGNFSHNASGSWTNHSIAIAGNTTPYHYIIGSGNFTGGQVVGWKFYVYDIAGNELDPIYTFSPNSHPASTATTTTSSSGGGGGTSIAKCQPYAVQFGTCYYYDAINQRCAQGCEQNSVCDTKTIVCQPTNSTIGAIESTNPIQSTISLWNKVKLWFKGLFGTEAPQLSISPLQAEKKPIEASGLVAEALQKANETIGINLGIVLSIFALLLLIIAIWTFGLAFVFTNPISLTIMGFISLMIYLIIKFKVFG